MSVAGDRQVSGSPVPSPAPKEKHPLWAPWLGVGLTLLAVFVLRFTGAGQKIAMVGMILAVVTAAMRWRRTAPSRRVMLLVVPAIIAPVMFVVYLSLPHGASWVDGPSLTNPNRTSVDEGEAGTLPGYDDPQTMPQAGPTTTAQGGSGGGEDGSHPQATVEGHFPTAEMEFDERLALWSELNPEGDGGPADPTAEDANEVWLYWVNHYIWHVVNPESMYSGPHKGEYWMSYGAVADPHNDLAAVPFVGGTQTEHHAFIWDSTSDGYAARWTGGEGDTVRTVTTKVDTNSGETLEKTDVRLELTKLDNGRTVILASIPHTVTPPQGSTATFEHFTVTVREVTREGGARVHAEVCVRSLPPDPQGDRTRISWDPWSVSNGSKSVDAAGSPGTSTGVFPIENTYRVGQCASGWIPFPTTMKPIQITYKNGIGDVAVWDATRLDASPRTS